MKYKIGDVARLLGITSEAIRHYEDQGCRVQSCPLTADVSARGRPQS